MAADVQHADAIRLVQNLEEQIIKVPNYHMTYSDAAAVLGRRERWSTYWPSHLSDRRSLL